MPGTMEERVAARLRELLAKVTKRNGDDGFGLGLYLTKRILQRQGGDGRYGAKDNGSNFLITHPEN